MGESPKMKSNNQIPGETRTSSTSSSSRGTTRLSGANGAASVTLMSTMMATIATVVILMWFGNVYTMQAMDNHPKPNQEIFQQGGNGKNNQIDSTSRSSDNQIVEGNHQIAVHKTQPIHNAEQESNSIQNTSQSDKQHSPYAYVWIIGAIHEDRPAYKGFLWTILISANILRKVGSTEDLWIYIRLSPDSKLDDLPSEDRRLLEAMGINIVLLEKPQHESFAQLVYDKFLTINMTDYKRVMFMDGDMIPMTNLDYYFHLSDPEYTALPTELKSNFIMASKAEPCNTGYFMVTPSKEAFDDYNEIIRKQLEIAKTLPYPYFDKRRGWGHNFMEAKDWWEAVSKNGGKKWSFHAGHSDQGLMYQFAKYTRQDVSISIGDRVQNWKKGEVDKPILESEVTGMLSKYQGELLRYQWSCNKPEADRRESDLKSMGWRCTPPYDSTAHFMGKTKPWRHCWRSKDYTDYSFRQFAPKYYWFRELEELNVKLNMGLDMHHWDSKVLPTMSGELLGLMAMPGDQREAQLAILGTASTL